MNIYARATRMKYRFPTSVGEITTEQLWDLSLIGRGGKPDLDTVARAVFTELKGMDEASFVNTKPDPRRSELEFKLEIVKDIIAVKQAEAASAEKRLENRQRREKLLSALADQQDAALKKLTPEEIKAELDKLGAED